VSNGKGTDYTGVEKLHAQTCEVKGRTKTKIYCKGTIYQRCILAVLQTVRLGLTKVGNQVKSLKYSENICISYQFRADVETYGHRPQYTADDTAETDVCSKIPGCCCFIDKGNEILFRINISPPLTMIVGVEGADQWLGHPGHQTSHQWTSCGTTLKLRFSHRQLILKRILLPVLLRQQQPSGRNLAFLSTRLSAVLLSAMNQG
jgi:hypothetical protein